MNKSSFHITMVIAALSAVLACERSDPRRTTQDPARIERQRYERALEEERFSSAAQILVEDATNRHIYRDHASFVRAADQLINAWQSSHHPPQSTKSHLLVARLARHAKLDPTITATHARQAFHHCLQDAIECVDSEDFVHEFPDVISAQEHDAIAVRCWVEARGFTESCRERHTLTTTLAQAVYNVAFLREEYQRAIEIARQGRLAGDAIATAQLSAFRSAVDHGDAREAIAIWKDSGSTIPLAVRRDAYHAAKQQGRLETAIALASLADVPRSDMKQLAKRLFEAHLEQHDPDAALRVAIEHPDSISITDLNRATERIWRSAGDSPAFSICRPLANGTMVCMRL